MADLTPPPPMWIEITVKGKTELVNMSKAERVYQDEEGVTCIEIEGEDGVIETETSVNAIMLRLGRLSLFNYRSPADSK
jgi:hypothetical protein